MIARGAKGNDVEHVLELTFIEPVTVDGDRLRAEAMIALSIDNLWRGLETLKDAYSHQRMDEIANISRGLSQISENLGLGLFARVARDVDLCGADGWPGAGGQLVPINAGGGQLAELDLGFV